MEESLSSREREQLQNLVLESADIFALDQSELSSTDLVTHVIDTGDTVPIKQHPFQESLGQPCSSSCQKRW